MRRAAATALAVIVLFPGLLSAGSAQDDERAAAVAAGLATLRDAQEPDGSIGGVYTPWAVMAVTAAGENPRTWRATAGGPNLMDALAEQYLDQDQTRATDWERGILAIVAAGEDPSSFGGKDWLARLRALHVAGQTGYPGDLNDDMFGILALRAAGMSTDDPQVRDSLRYLLKHQRDNGAWSLRTSAADSDNVDLTGIILCALTEAGVPATHDSIVQALDWLEGQQAADGGFPNAPGGSAGNPWTTVYALHGLHCAGEDPEAERWTRERSPVGFLLAHADLGGAWQAREVVRVLAHPTFPVRPPDEPTPEPPVDSPPTAHLQASTRSTDRNATVEFDARGSSDPEDGPLAFRWHVSDGTSVDWGASPVLRHRFQEPGPFTVTLEVRDDLGQVATATVDVEVRNLAPVLHAPEALTATRTEAPPWNLTQAEDPEGDALAWRWDFGDGNVTDTSQPEHRYGHLGNHTVHVRITDAFGAVAEASFPVEVRNLPPRLVVEGPTRLAAGEPANFTARASDPDGTAPTLEWLTGGPNTTFQDAGEYEVRVAAVDADGARVERALRVIVEAGTPEPQEKAPPGPQAPEILALSVEPVAPEADEPFRVRADIANGTPVQAVTFSWPGGTARADSAPWSATVPGLPPGTHEIVAIAEAPSGHRTGRTLEVPVSDHALRTVNESPAEPDAFDTRVNLTAPDRVRLGETVQVTAIAPDGSGVEMWTSTGETWTGDGHVEANLTLDLQGPVRVWARAEGDAWATSALILVEPPLAEEAPARRVHPDDLLPPPMEATPGEPREAPATLALALGALALAGLLSRRGRR